MSDKKNNKLDKNVIEDFGNEWKNFDQSSVNDVDLMDAFNQYFNIFPKDFLNKDKEGFDMVVAVGDGQK